MPPKKSRRKKSGRSRKDYLINLSELKDDLQKFQKPKQKKEKKKVIDHIKSALSLVKNKVRKETHAQKVISDITTEQEIEEEPVQNTNNDAQLKVAVERLQAQVSAMVEYKKVTQERFLAMAEEAGILRGNITNVEKDMRELATKVTRAISIVEAVKPEEIHKEVLKVGTKVQAAEERSESEHLLLEKVREELKEIRSKMNLYRGVEQVLKTLKEVEDEHIEIRKLKAGIERYADKITNVYIDVKKKFDRFQNFERIGQAIEDTNEHVREELETLQSESSQFVTREEFEDLEDANEMLMEKINELKSDIAQLYKKHDVTKTIEKKKPAKKRYVKKKTKPLEENEDDIILSKKPNQKESIRKKVKKLLQPSPTKKIPYVTTLEQEHIGDEEEYLTSKAHRIIRSYIEEAEREGQTYEEIRDHVKGALVKSGWPERAVDFHIERFYGR